MNPSKIVVRPAREADAAPISLLLNELGYPLDVAALKNNIAVLSSSLQDRVLVAEADESINEGIVGVISFHIMPLFHVVGSLGRITSLVVSSQWQRRGVGRQLVQAVEEFAWSHGCLRIEVTSSDQRTGAHEFYHGLGYQLDERRFIKRPAKN